MRRTRMRPAGVAMLLTAMVAVPLAASAAPYVGPSSSGTATIWTIPGNAGPVIGIASNGYVATSLTVWTGAGYPLRVPVPDVTGTNYGIADINNSGTVAGWYLAPAGTDSTLRRGFVWNPGDAEIQDVGNPGLELEITGIDDAGRVVGWYTAGAGVCDSTAGHCGFIIEPEPDGSYGFIEQIGPAGGVEDGSRFLPLDIGAGIVVGSSWTWDPNEVDPFERWKPLVGPISGSVGQGASINEGGQIAGSWVPTQGEPEALYWPHRTSSPISIGTTGDDLIGQAYGIGDNGAVAGWTSTSLTGDRQAWVWKDEVGIVELGHVPGGAPTAEAYDAHGDLVVGSAGGRGVIWDGSGAFSIDYPPEIAPIESVTVATGDLVQVEFDITDFEGDEFAVTCSGVPLSATCADQGNAWSLTWQTEPGDAGNYIVAVIATQAGFSSNTHTVTFRLSVVDGIVLQPIGDQEGAAGQTLMFTATASGGDPISYTYSPQIPGATLDSVTGVFEWTPTLDQVGAHEITVVASAVVNRINVSDSETLTITVTDPGSPPSPIEIIVNETIGVGDTITVQGPVVINVTEIVGVSDVVGVRPPVVIRVGETVRVSDTVSVRPPVMITVGETIGVSHGVSVRPPVSITVNETVGVSEAVTIGGNAPIVITITEVVGVADSTAVRPPVVISVLETIGTIDSITVEAESAVTVESILDFVATLDDDDFKLGSGARRAVERLIAAADRSLDALDSALARVDGCGDSADRNDLIVNCDAQREVRRLLMLLREQMTNED